MSKIEKENIELYLGDVLEQFKNIEDNSINLVLMDPPYNISVKNKKWDKWKKESFYIDFMTEVFKESERVLKSNGTMYWFHNDFNQYTKLHLQITENTSFNFNSKITWVKPDIYGIGWKNPSSKNNLRSWFNTSEEIFYYTFEDGTGLDRINKDINNYSNLREYSKKINDFIDVNKKVISNKINGSVDHFFRFNSSQWSLPTKETYEDLIHHFNIDKFEGFRTYEDLRLEYEDLRLEYEDLRLEYEDLRYTHNLFKNHNNIWHSESKNNTGKLHPTQKPLDILERIIKTSSKENDVVLDCFMGTGSTGVACLNTNRKFIGIEKEEEYFEHCKDRILNNYKGI